MFTLVQWTSFWNKSEQKPKETGGVSFVQSAAAPQCYCCCCTWHFNGAPWKFIYSVHALWTFVHWLQTQTQPQTLSRDVRRQCRRVLKGISGRPALRQTGSICACASRQLSVSSLWRKRDLIVPLIMLSVLAIKSNHNLRVSNWTSIEAVRHVAAPSRLQLGMRAVRAVASSCSSINFRVIDSISEWVKRMTIPCIRN